MRKDEDCRELPSSPIPLSPVPRWPSASLPLPPGHTWRFVDQFGQSERIIACAYEFCGVIFSMPQPARHGAIIRQAYLLNPYLSLDPDASGFLTTRGRFVDRIEGALVAEHAGQRLRITGAQTTLYSEDLW